MPKVSVIVPVYNAEKYIERCAKSLFGQTLRDMEYIFVNDCSPDRSIEVLQRVLNEYPERVSQVNIVNLEINGGVSAARQRGTDIATGEYLIHCDPDDWVELNMYETLYNIAESEGVDLVMCDFCYVTDDSVVHTVNCCPDEFSGLGLLRCISGASLHRLHGSLCNKLIKSTCYINNTQFPRGVNFCEDVSVLFQLLPCIKKIAYVNRALYYYYRMNESSITSVVNINMIQTFFDWLEENIIPSDNPEVSGCGKACIMSLVLNVSLLPLGLTSSQFRSKFGRYKSYLKYIEMQLTPTLLLQKFSCTVDYKLACLLFGFLGGVKRFLSGLKRNKG